MDVRSKVVVFYGTVWKTVVMAMTTVKGRYALRTVPILSIEWPDSQTCMSVSLLIHRHAGMCLC